MLRGVAISLGLFALLRLGWTQHYLILPFTQAQATLAASWFGAAAQPVAVTSACSGTDAIALCLGAVLAYPVVWRARLAGAAGGVGLIVALNIIRIGTLGRAAASPAWFDALHLYIWPAVLTLAVAGYALAWMHGADRGAIDGSPSRAPQPSRRFVLLSAVFLLVFVAIAPLYLDNDGVRVLAGVVARGGAWGLTLVGIGAHAEGNILWTDRGGGFLVTQECIATPLIPVYLAAVCAYAPTRRGVLLGVLATAPIFVALGIARLLLVALPETAVAPLFWVHGFYQLLAGVIAVCVAAVLRHRATAGRRAVAGLAVGGLCALPAALFVAPLIAAGGGSAADPQGAIAFLPVFQVALYAALCVAASAGTGWTRHAAGLAALCVTCGGALAALHLAAVHAGIVPHVRDVRAWAIAAPVVIASMVMRDARARR